MAHRKGMRIARVCAWKTSALAFDGSGKVERDPDNHSLCTFTNGKRYNCDLSASYNIGARYFIRELTKPMPATAWSVLEAEVPAVRRRSSCNKTHAGDGMVRAGGGSPCSTAQKLMCPCGPGQA